MDVGDAPRHRVLDRQHAVARAAASHRRDRRLEIDARQRREARKHFAAGEIGISASRALKGDQQGRVLA
jgi:hypothetical protein